MYLKLIPEMVPVIEALFERVKVKLRRTSTISYDYDINYLEKSGTQWWFCWSQPYGKEITFEELKKELEPPDTTIPMVSMRPGQIALYKGQENNHENDLIDAVIMCVFNKHYGVKQYVIIKRGPNQPKRAKKSIVLLDAYECVKVQLIESCLIETVDVTGAQE